jgi:hypothetical protein
MHHTGELFIETPEGKHPINKRLILKTVDHDPPRNGEMGNPVLFSLNNELMGIILEYFGVGFDELLAFATRDRSKQFPAHVMRVKLLNEIETSVQGCVIPTLENYYVINYDIVDVNAEQA